MNIPGTLIIYPYSMVILLGKYNQGSPFMWLKTYNLPVPSNAIEWSLIDTTDILKTITEHAKKAWRERLEKGSQYLEEHTRRSNNAESTDAEPLINEHRSKLIFYSSIKPEFKCADYFNHLSAKDARVLFNFRVSNHLLYIARGRYNNTPVIDRLCQSCQRIDNECHLAVCRSPMRFLHRENFYTIDFGISEFLHLIDNPTSQFACF